MSSTLRISLASIGLLAAVVLGMLGYKAMNPPTTLPAQMASVVQSLPAPLQVDYLVAAHPLPAGTMARDEDFAARSVSPSDLPSNAIVDTPDARSSLRGSLVRNYIDAGNPVAWESVLRPRDRGFLASVLETGTRAVSISVDAVTGVSGLVWPGDHVDVLLTHEIEQANLAHRALSEMVLSNARVIAIDQEIVQGGHSDNATAGKVVRTVTLQVIPTQVERLKVAEHLGKLSLSIRSATDQPDTVVHATTYGGDVSPAMRRVGIGAATINVYEGNQSAVTYEGDKVREFTYKAGDKNPLVGALEGGRNVR